MFGLLASEDVAHGVRVIALCPSWAKTPMMSKEIKRLPALPGVIKSTVPLWRAANVDEVTDSIPFMSSPASSCVTGIRFVVDGVSCQLWT